MNQEWWALSGGRAWHGVIPGCEKVALPQEGKKSGVVLQRSEGARSSRSAKAEEERGDESTRFRPLSHDDLLQAKPLPELKEPVAEEKNNAEVEKSRRTMRFSISPSGWAEQARHYCRSLPPWSWWPSLHPKATQTKCARGLNHILISNKLMHLF